MPLAQAEPWLNHLTSCSPCYRDFNQFREAHQLAVLHANAPPRLHLRPCDRLLWVLLSRFWSGDADVCRGLNQNPVIDWHRKVFVLHCMEHGNRGAVLEGRE